MQFVAKHRYVVSIQIRESFFMKGIIETENILPSPSRESRISYLSDISFAVKQHYLRLLLANSTADIRTTAAVEAAAPVAGFAFSPEEAAAGAAGDEDPVLPCGVLPEVGALFLMTGTLPGVPVLLTTTVGEEAL